MIAGLNAMRRKGSAEPVYAIPVAHTPSDIFHKLKGEADRVMYLSSPDNLHALEKFYARFPQITDEEVITCLADSVRTVSNKSK